eukprot:16931-Prymnesium_polylepis.1
MGSGGLRQQPDWACGGRPSGSVGAKVGGSRRDRTPREARVPTIARPYNGAPLMWHAPDMARPQYGTPLAWHVARPYYRTPREARVGVVDAEQQPVLGARREHSVRLARAARDQVVDQHSHITLRAPQLERWPAERALRPQRGDAAHRSHSGGMQRTAHTNRKYRRRRERKGGARLEPRRAAATWRRFAANQSRGSRRARAASAKQTKPRSEAQRLPRECKNGPRAAPRGCRRGAERLPPRRPRSESQRRSPRRR